MAVFTPVSAHELKVFLSSYDIGERVAHEGIKAGVSNTNFFITTTTGRYILTLFEPRRVRSEDIPFFMDYAICLEQNGVPCPKTLVRKDKTTRGELNDRPAAIFSILNGEGGDISSLTPTMCERGGEVLARMHLAARNITATAPNHFGMDRWRSWLAQMGGDMNRIASGLYKFAADEFDYVGSHWPKDLPSGAIHADYFPDNVFFDGGDVTGVIDFHFVCSDFFVYDLAIALNAWCFDENNHFQQTRMDSFLRGYQSMRPLNKEELLSMPVLLRAAALRFLLSRIEEKLQYREGDFMKPHDPMVFYKRLQHFQLTGFILS